MGVRTFESDKDRAQSTARQVLGFISKYLHLIDKKHAEAAKSMARQTYPLSDKQLSYVDGIYEMVMAGMGLESVSRFEEPSKHWRG